MVSCAGSSGSIAAPASLEENLRDSDPLHPPFERLFEQDRDVFESLLAIDHFVHPRLDIGAARNAFEDLCGEARGELERERTRRRNSPTPEDYAAAFLKSLDRRQFVYDVVPIRFPGDPDSKVVSFTLLHKRGCCGTFSLLCAAFLQRMGVESYLVCLPDHCFIRVRNGLSLVDIESTNFLSPLRGVFDGEPSAPERSSSTHYGRCLVAEQALWHYFVDRLWCWVPWRITDRYALEALDRAKAVLGSTCQAFEAQKDRRRELMAAGRRRKA